MKLDLAPCPPLDAAHAEPPAIVEEAMRRHRRDVHGLSFQLGRDVEWPGHRPARATLTYSPPDPQRGASFWCAKRECRHKRFLVTEPPYGDPERNALLLRYDPALRRASAGLEPDERGAYVEAYDRGELARSELRAVRARSAQQVAKRRRPSDRQRIEGAQAYLLEARGRLPKDEAAIDEFVALAERDPKRYRDITGGNRPVRYETVRRYWKQLPLDKRAAARARYDALPEAKKQQIVTALRLGK